MYRIMGNNQSYSGEIITKTFFKYLIPCFITWIAIQVTDFCDSFIVSHLLGPSNLAIVNIGISLKCVLAATFMLTSMGGSIIYANAMGEKRPDKAKQYFTLAMIVSLILSIFILSFGMIFLEQITDILCKTKELQPDFKSYARIIFLSMPFFITVMTFATFLPAAGYPQLALFTNISANILNAIFDFIYIKYFNTGVNGTALATITAYFIVIIIPIIMLLRKKLDIYLVPVSLANLKDIPKVLRGGIISFCTQIGNAIKFGFCCSAVTSLGGTDGMVTLAVCLQALIIIVLFMGAITDTTVPILSVLLGQKSYDEIKFIFKKALMLLIVCATFFTAFFYFCPDKFIHIYGIRDVKTVIACSNGLKIFTLGLLVRTFCFILMNLFNVMKYTWYSIIISLFDGAVGIVLLGSILSNFFGITGIWMAFPADSIILFIAILIINTILLKKNPQKYSGLLLVPAEEPDSEVFYATFSDSEAELPIIWKNLNLFMANYNIENKTEELIYLSVEEMVIYTRNHGKVEEKMDLMMRISPEYVTLDFRSLGRPFNPMVVTDVDCPTNVKLLNGISEKTEYAFTMGMNSTRITLKRKPAV